MKGVHTLKDIKSMVKTHNSLNKDSKIKITKKLEKKQILVFLPFSFVKTNAFAAYI
jgi:hypothetical protein